MLNLTYRIGLLIIFAALIDNPINC